MNKNTYLKPQDRDRAEVLARMEVEDDETHWIWDVAAEAVGESA